MIGSYYKGIPGSRREHVANILREAILTGKLKSGERLREADISDKLKVSRGPIREAIRQLEQEGLLITYPYKETIVADIHEDEIEKVFTPIRILLETHSLGKGFETISAEDIEVLETYVEGLLASCQKNDLPGLVENNLLFHEHIVGLSKSKTLEHIWHSIINRLRIHFYQLGLSEQDMLQDVQEHRNILEAIKSKDATTAIDLLRNHIK